MAQEILGTVIGTSGRRPGIYYGNISPVTYSTNPFLVKMANGSLFLQIGLLNSECNEVCTVAMYQKQCLADCDDSVWVSVFGSDSFAIRTVYDDTAFTPSDVTIVVDTVTPVTVTLLDAADYSGRIQWVKLSIGSTGGSVTIDSLGGLVEGSPTLVLSTEGDVATLQSDGTNWIKI